MIVLMSDGQPADKQISDLTRQKIQEALGKFNIAIGRYDFTADFFVYSIAEKYPDFVYSHEIPPPFNDNAARTAWILKFIKWIDLPSETMKFSEWSLFEKSSEKLWEHRKNVQHGYIHLIKIKSPIEVQIRKIDGKKYPKNAKERQFHFQTRSYSLDVIHEATSYANACANVLLQLGGTLQLVEFLKEQVWE